MDMKRKLVRTSVLRKKSNVGLMLSGAATLNIHQSTTNIKNQICQGSLKGDWLIVGATMAEAIREVKHELKAG